MKKFTLTINCDTPACDENRIEEVRRLLDLVNYQLIGSSMNRPEVAGCMGSLVDVDANTIGVWEYVAMPDQPKKRRK